MGNPSWVAVKTVVMSEGIRARSNYLRKTCSPKDLRASGTVEFQDFVDRLVEGVTCFLLGGRAWAVLEVRHDDRRVVVGPAPRGKQPTWGGFIPQFLSEPICRKTCDVLASDESYGYLTPEAIALLAERRDALAGVVASGSPGVQIDDNEIRWWTFAGGRINPTRRPLQSLVPSVFRS